MPFGAAPDLTFRPHRQGTQFLDFRVRWAFGIRQWQPGRIEALGFAAHGDQKSFRFVCKETRVGAFAQRAVQEQDARRVLRHRPRKPRHGWRPEMSAIERRQFKRSRERGLAHRARRSYQGRLARTIRTTDSITGTSTSTPTTVASAAPDWKPNNAIAVATASSKKLLAPISAEGPGNTPFDAKLTV